MVVRIFFFFFTECGKRGFRDLFVTGRKRRRRSVRVYSESSSTESTTPRLIPPPLPPNFRFTEAPLAGSIIAFKDSWPWMVRFPFAF